MKKNSEPKKPTKRRTQGRPDTDQSVGKEVLIQATITQLKTCTPEALTLAGIAAEANVHPALIRYYFGDKDGLLREVTAHLVDTAHEFVRTKLESKAPLADKLADRLSGMIALVEENPHYHRLMLDKIYNTNKDWPTESPLSRITSRGMQLTTAMLYDGDSHKLRSIDPRFLHVALIGLTQFFVSAKPLLQELFGEDADMEELKTRYIAFVQTLILQGITQPE